MSYTLHNSHYQFTIDPSAGRWRLSSQKQSGPELEGVEMSLRYAVGRSIIRTPLANLYPGQQVSGPASTAHGPSQVIYLTNGADRNGISCRLTFSLPAEAPLFLWKIEVENRGNRPVYMDRIELLNAGFIYAEEVKSAVTRIGRLQEVRSRVQAGPQAGDLAFFSNGWQSWSYTGVYAPHDRYRQTRLGPARAPVGLNRGTPRPKRRGLFSSDMFGILGDRTSRNGILSGFLSQKEQFGSVEALIDGFGPALRMWANGDRARLDPGASISTDWACLMFLHLDGPDPLDPYLEAAGRENGVQPRSFTGEPPVGWLSWYTYFHKIRPDDVLTNLEAAIQNKDTLPLEVIQLDDGFQAKVGDWEDYSPAFAGGVSSLSAAIARSGFTPGLWLAPFIVHPGSRLAAQHPEWLLRNKWGRPVNAGYFWNTFTNALDISVPAALDFTAEAVMRAAKEWGFPYLKLDFLYAAALPGRYHDSTLTRAQVLRQGLKTLREAAGEDTFLLGCSCPLGPAVGLVDAMRIGADTEAFWKPYRGFSFGLSPEPDLPAARNAIHNTLTRASLHRCWWINDPDCLILRTESSLTLDEIKTAASVVAFSGGSLFISDNLNALPKERRKIAEVLLPLIGRRPSVPDWFDGPRPAHLRIDLQGACGSWHLLAIFNWQDRRQDLALRLDEFALDGRRAYFARSFWDSKLYLVPPAQPSRRDQRAGSSLIFPGVPAHGVIVLAVREAQPEQPQYIGSSLHISQGLEVSGWEWDGERTLRFSLERPGFSEGEVSLSLPSPLTGIQVNKSEGLHHQAAFTGTDTLYTNIPLSFVGKAAVEVSL